MPPHRDVESKSAQTRFRIVDAAARILSRNGYAAFRLADVARQADVRTPAIYYYFPSRDDLITEVLWVGIAETCEHVRSAVDGLAPDAEPLDRLAVAVEAHLLHLLELSDYATAFIRNARQVPMDIRDRVTREEERYGHLWRELLAGAAEVMDPRLENDLRTTELLILGALNWTAEWRTVRTLTVNETVDAAKIFVRKALSGSRAMADRPD